MVTALLVKQSWPADDDVCRQMAYEMGYKAVETMVQVLDGETVDEFVDSGSDVVTPDNAQERLDTLKTQLH